MPGLESSQGAEVVFDGVVIGYLRDYSIDAAAGQLVDVTNATSAVVGTGANTRVMRVYECTSVEPAKLTINFWGPPSYTVSDCGKKGTLSITTQTMSYGGTAILVDWNYSGSVNTYTTGRASFQFVGT